MTPRRRVDPDIQSEVERLALEGATPAQIERDLAKMGVPSRERPSRRTLQRMVQAVLVQDRSGPWSLADAEGDEAQLVMPVLRAYLNLMSFRAAREKRDLYITKAEARWIVRVSRAAPDLHVFNIYRMARAYLARESRGQPTYDLDALLAFEPWDDEPRTGPLGEQGFMRDTYQKGVREGWIPPAPRFLMKELADVDWTPKKREWDVYTRAVYAHDPDAWEEAAVLEEDESPEGGQDGEAGKR